MSEEIIEEQETNAALEANENVSLAEPPLVVPDPLSPFRLKLLSEALQRDAEGLMESIRMFQKMRDQMTNGTIFMSDFKIGQTIYGYDSDWRTGNHGYTEVEEIIIKTFTLERLGLESDLLFVRINDRFFISFCHATREEAEAERARMISYLTPGQDDGLPF